MRIFIHIGLPHCGANRLQNTLDDKRDQLINKGILYPLSPGRKNHTRLFMAVTEPDHIDPLRWNRGYASAQAQARLCDTVQADLSREIERAAPDTLILSATQFSASLMQQSELSRLRDLLSPHGDDFRIIVHVDEQARLLARHYADQVIEGRLTPLQRDIDLAQTGQDWRGAALAAWQTWDGAQNDIPEIQQAPFWLDYPALIHSWEAIFGPASVTLRPYDPALFATPDLSRELGECFGLPANIGKAEPAKPTAQPSAAWISRTRAINGYFHQALGMGHLITRQQRRRLVGQLQIDGPAIMPGSLQQVSDFFHDDNAALLQRFPGLGTGCLTPDSATAPWAEAPPENGFRASQYMSVFLPAIEQSSREEKQRQQSNDAPREAQGPTLSAALPAQAVENYHHLAGGRFAPRNHLPPLNEDQPGDQYYAVPKRALPPGNSGNVIVGCMKNEAPYILEWVAYHRAIGVDNFLIYTNGCEDGTAEILDRLQEMGIVQHRNNDDWRGNSPQQFALNQSLKEPLIEDAEWIIHIDVDEFMNIRTGNGTVQDFLNQVPDATNVAMTWRLFGHNGVARFEDKPVIGQFDTCAPKYCPKPHTVWGFKTMFKNIGAYEKISCHRPNKLREGKRAKVAWVNGSGQPMADKVLDRGWRSEMRSVGYELLQLNHYALRSAESFLVKRQRGRALHVDRTIGLNYWVRMDWSYHRDVTIQRNMDRLGDEMAALMADQTLAGLHLGGVDWHRKKLQELHDMDEFEELYTGALNLELSELERVAYALALDMES